MEAREGSNMNQSLEVLNNEQLQAQEDQAQKMDVYVPAKKIEKIMKEILPHHAIVEGETIEMMQDELTKFVNRVTVEANKQTQNAGRKTVRASDILSGMENLGLKDYIDPLTAYIENYRKHKINAHNPSANPTLNIQEPAEENAE